MAALGGIASRADLLGVLPRTEVDAALRQGRIVADRPGRYALPVADTGLRAAHAHRGVLCLTSAALHHGWEVLRAPDRPHLLLPERRKVPPDVRRTVHVHRRDLHSDDRAGFATSVELTLEQCARHLDLDEALAVTDSALRHGVTPSTLRRVARSARGAGAPRVRRVLASGSADAANPFESGLRAVALEVAGLSVQPQVQIECDSVVVRPDLVDRDLQVVLEADSFAWHGGRADLVRDAHRYNTLVAAGWTVLRFTWEDVMFDQDYIRRTLVSVVERARRRGEVAPLPQCPPPPSLARVP